MVLLRSVRKTIHSPVNDDIYRVVEVLTQKQQQHIEYEALQTIWSEENGGILCSVYIGAY